MHYSLDNSNNCSSIGPPRINLDEVTRLSPSPNWTICEQRGKCCPAERGLPPYLDILDQDLLLLVPLPAHVSTLLVKLERPKEKLFAELHCERPAQACLLCSNAQTKTFNILSQYRSTHNKYDWYRLTQKRHLLHTEMAASANHDFTWHIDRTRWYWQER